jgi:hypothetical protein
MASGDITHVAAGSMGALLLDAVDGTALNNGVWVDCREYHSGTVTVSGVATLAVLTIYGSNALARPLDTLNSGTITVTGNPTSAATNPTVPIPVLPRWIKCGITTVGTGTVSATLNVRKQ